ncbi:DNA integrity scanning protein DisA [Candidatus Pacearchaeota archaeon]|nr:DNA integrity scanning protein DisA [Candidatus Pacearchaeota archaeon]
MNLEFNSNANLDEKKEEKKEVQITILPPVQNNSNGRVSEEEFSSILKTVAPGTNLRNAIDGVLKSGKGALIALESETIIPLIDGGFRVNCRFTPQRLIELSKMDGAIILSKDVKRIVHANVLLTPDSKIKTSETGTRHKAAERTAKQSGSLVIAISEKKRDINIYYKNIKYNLKNTEDIRRKTNENIQLLEKQRDLFDNYIDKLNKLELRNYPSLHQAIFVIQKGRLIQRISEDMKRFIVELGNEGTLLKTRLKEITSGVEKELNLIIKDYTKLDVKKSKILLESLTYDELLDPENILKAMAYEALIQIEPIKGWRILSKTSLQEQDIAKLLKEAGSLGEAIHSNIKLYFDIIGEDKARIFKDEIEKIKLNPWQLK